MCRFFKLEGKTAVPVSTAEYYRWVIEDPYNGFRRVSADEFFSDTEEEVVEVSTTFLMGINHRWMDGTEPLLFETMVFGGTMDLAQWRYSTWEQAEAGHEEVVARLLQEMPHLKKKVDPNLERKNIPTRTERVIRNICHSKKN